MDCFSSKLIALVLQIESIKKSGSESKTDDSPRIFALHK